MCKCIATTPHPLLYADVLNFLRMADNKITLDLREFDVNDFVTQVCTESIICANILSTHSQELTALLCLLTRTVVFVISCFIRYVVV